MKKKTDLEKEATSLKEVVMKETQGSASDSEEEFDPDTCHDMELEEIVVDLPVLKETHGTQKIKNLTISQLRKLQIDLMKGKWEGSSQGLEETMLGNLGIILIPLRPRRIPQERKKRKEENHTAKKLKKRES
jgi:hypothetical protein